jgi:hypothetical protein
MPLVIYRRDLTNGKEPEVVARYENVTVYAGNKFIDGLAINEADRRPNECKSISAREVNNDLTGTVTHVVTLMGHRSESLVEYYGEWPVE